MSTFRHQAGYTLIELIVVLLIIGITLTAVIPRISLRDSAGDIDSHVNAIGNMIRLVRDESAIRGRILGLAINTHEANMLQLNNGEWEPASQLALSSHAVEPPFSLLLANNDPPFASDEDTDMPLLFLPDGQGSLFEIIVSEDNGHNRYTIKQDYDGLHIKSAF